MKIARALSAAVVVLAVAVAVTPAAAFDITDFAAAGVRIAPESEPVVPGEWHLGWAKCKAYADENGLPMFAVWSNRTCFHCGFFDELLVTDRFKEWQASDKGKIVLCFMAGGESGCPDQEFSAAYDWAGGTGGSWSEGQYPWQGYLNDYPWICFYWAAKEREYHVSGDDLRGGTFADEETGLDNLFAAFDKWFDGFPEKPKYSGGSFKVGEGVSSRLEIEIGKTLYVDVPLVRTNGVEYAATNMFSAGGVASPIFWSENETGKFFRVPVPGGTHAAGEKLVFRLADETGTNIVAESSAVYVAPADSSLDNPLWFGERTAATLAAGEWTMDLDVAKARTAGQTGDAWTLVAVVGSLWCPDCKRLATNLTEKAEFSAWASENNVSLVQVDAPYGTGDGPCLLTYEETWGRSGAGYLSRKMADAGKAAAALETNRRLYSVEWTRTPGRRVLLPTLLLLDKKGVVKARIGDDKLSFDPAYMINRLDEMIAAAGEPSEEADWTSAGATPIETGSAVSASLSAVDADDCYSIVQSSGRVRATLSRRNASQPGKGVLSIENADGELVALSAFGSGDGFVSVSADVQQGVRLYVHVAMDTASLDSPQYMAKKNASTVFPYSLALSEVAVPSERYTVLPVVDAMRQNGFTIQIKKGQAYRLEGIAELSADLQAHLVKSDVSGPAGEILYQGLQDCDIVLPVAAGAESVGYALWNGGEVAFTDVLAARMVYERDADAAGVYEVVFGVSRTGGSSGAVSVKVSLIDDKTTCYADRFYFEETTLAWGDGETGEKKVSFLLFDDSMHDETQTIAFEISPVGGGVVTIPEEGREAIFEIRDDDSADPGFLAIAGSTPAFTGNRSTAAVENTEIEFLAVREPGLSGGLSGECSAVLQISDAYGNVLGRSARLEWAHRSEDNGKTVRLALPGYDASRRIVYAELVSAEGAPVDSSRNRVSIEILPANAPAFEESRISESLYRFVRAYASVKLVNTGSDAVETVKVSGSLPPGMAAGCIMDAEGVPVFAVSGVPVKAGNYRAVYRIASGADGSPAGGNVICVDMAVRDVPVEDTAAGGDGDGAVATPNPAIAKAVAFQNIPVVAKVGYDAESTAVKGVYGLLSFAVSTFGRASAKFVSTDDTARFIADGWSGYNPETGDIDLVFSYSGAQDAGGESRGRYLLEATVHPSGNVSVRMQIESESFEMEVDPSGWGGKADLSAFKGRYNVQLPQEIAIGRYPGQTLQGDGAMAAMSLRMVSPGAVGMGRMAYVAYLPDGRCASGVSTLFLDRKGNAHFPYCHAASGAGAFAGELVITPYAKDTHTQSPNWFVKAADGITPYWRCGADMVFAGLSGGESAGLGVYGGYYDGDETLLYSCCLTTYGSASLWFVADRLVSLRDGGVSAVMAPAPVSILESGGISVPDDAGSNPSRLRVSFDRANGVFSGTARMYFGENARKRTLSFRGVVMPGWGGCEDCGRPLPRPVGAGPCWFSDNLDGYRFRSSGVMAIDAIKDE